MIKFNKRIIVIPIIFCIGIILFVNRQNQFKIITYFSDSISISPGDHNIIFSYYYARNATIYKADIDGKNVKPVTKFKKVFDVCPTYSPDGTKIMFLSFPNAGGKLQSDIYIMDADGSNQKQITFGKQHITEAIFSPNGETIYFLKSNYFGHYSPIATCRPHEFDIYSINISGNNLKRLTNISAYEMDGLSISSDGKKLLASGTYDNDKDGLLLLSLDNLQMDYFTPKKPKYITNSQYSSDGKTIVFLAFSGVREDGVYKYDIFLMNTDSQEIKQITNLGIGDLHSFRFFHTQKKLLFMVGYGNAPPKLMQMNLDGSGLKEIILEKNGRNGADIFKINQ